jgi:hypothetical protein
MLELLPFVVCNCFDEKVVCTTYFYLFFGCEVEGGGLGNDDGGYGVFESAGGIYTIV